MNTSQAVARADQLRLARPGSGNCHAAARRTFDWAGQIKLAIVLSIVAAITASALAGRVAEPVLIVGVIVVASFAAWSRIEPVATSARIPVRRR